MSRVHDFAGGNPWVALLRAMWLAFGLLISFPGSAAEPFRVGDLVFTAPMGWERMQSDSRMRKAQFIIRNDRSGDDGLVIFFHFGPGQGGGPDANIRRWYGQFAEPNEELGARVGETTIGGRRLHDFRATGTLLAGQGRKIPNYSLLAAILENPGGDVFVRLVAPKALATRHEAGFRKLVEDAMRGSRQ